MCEELYGLACALSQAQISLERGSERAREREREDGSVKDKDRRREKEEWGGV